MFNSKSLTDDQIATISKWVDEGAQLADIQKKMEAEFEFRLTYMDTRFLVLDLGLEIKSDEPEEVEEPVDNEASGADELTEDDIEVLPHNPSAGNVAVTVDEVARPGVMASGRVTFTDGQTGMWYVDETGRLGVDPDTADYQPSESDVMAFQRELQLVMDKQ